MTEHFTTTPLPQPHIGLNAHLLSLQQSYRSAGISWYIYNLLANLPGTEMPYRYTAFLSDPEYQPPTGLAVQRSRLPTHKPIIRILWEQTMLPRHSRRQKLNLLHALAFVAPVAASCPYITTVFDLSFWRFPEAFKPFNRWYLNTFTRLSSRRAKAVIAISESTRRDMMTAFGISPAKVHTIYCGVDSVFKPLPGDQVKAFKTSLGLPAHFIFRLGTLEPRKNVAGLITAYARWLAIDPAAPPLVIGGGKGWYYRHVFKLVTDLNLTDHIIFPGYIPQPDLPMWYNAADLFVYPSLFEGFGLPVLEAMACGTPVITSNVSSLPEVAGEAARLVDPTNPNALAQAMQTVFADHSLAKTMRQRGLHQAATFSWQKTARQTADLYRQVLEEI